MKGMHKLIFVAAGLAVSVWFASCTKVHTGDTGEQAGLASQYKADRIRDDWKSQIQNASPIEKAGLLVNYFESITELYFQIGYQTIDNWRAFERQAQREVDSAEIQAMIDQWYQTNRAYVIAHNENIGFAASQIRFDGYFAESFLVELDSLLDAHRRVRDAVLHPIGTLADYELAFRQLEFEIGDIARRYRERLKLL